MDHDINSAGEIRSILTDAEECLREGRMQEAQDIALPLIPYVADCKEILDGECHRIKLRLYAVLMGVPGFRFCEPEQLDAMAATQQIFRTPKEYTLAERLQAHVIYAHVKPDAPRREEWNECNALETAKKVLENIGSDAYLDALAHHLICSRSPFEEDKRQHIEELFRIPIHERGPLLTTLCCTKVWPSIHIATDDKYIEQALTEVQDPFFRARLFLKKMQSIVYRLVVCEKFSERMDWLEQYEGEMETLMTHILTTPKTERLIVFAHCMLAHRFACFAEPNATFTHVHLAKDLAKILGDPEVIDMVERTGSTVEALVEDVQNEDDEDDDDEEDDDEDDGEEWKNGRDDWLKGED